MSEGEARVVPLHAETEFEKSVLRTLKAIEGRLSAMEDRLGKIEEKISGIRKAVRDLVEESVQTRRELAARIDAVQVESEVLAQAAEGARRDAEKAERACHRLAQQREDARRFAGLEDNHSNGNGRYSSAPPPPKDA